MVEVIEGRLHYSMVKSTASCIVTMPVGFTIYITHREIGRPAYWYRALRTPDEEFVYPLILWTDVRAQLLVGDHAWATVLIGQEGTPVVEGAHGMHLTVSMFGA